MLPPKGVEEKPGQPDEDDAKANADRVSNVQDICILLCPKVQIGWVHLYSSIEDDYTDFLKRLQKFFFIFSTSLIGAIVSIICVIRDFGNAPKSLR